MTPPKPLTDAERAAVDAAIAAGRLKRIPLGVYAECAYTPVPMREQIRRGANAGKTRAARRRFEALRLRAAGLTIPQIAARLSITPGSVYGYLKGAAKA